LIASSNGDIEVVKALLGAGANPNHALPNGQTVLMSAVVNGQGKVIDLLPIGADEVEGCEPIYETMPGWQETTFGVKRWEDLPQAARNYLNRLEVLCGIPIDIVSTGPERDETILKRHPFH
ncbi:MAG TPA: adenylosuccinate synthetase, partial [Rhodocyclaceae bacterium]|nr:adenylosuccinate synthetase [Rhodocyclaceae bacterium]